jgi:hypothetical protein
VIVTPVPDNPIDIGEFVALLVIVALPFTAPGEVGSNDTVRVAFWLGVSVKPAGTPEPVKPVPVTIALEIVTFELPVFVSVTIWETVVPSFTLPKVRLELLALSVRVVTEPVPVKSIASGEFGALLTREIDPEKLPVAVGVNVALKLADWPG